MGGIGSSGVGGIGSKVVMCTTRLVVNSSVTLAYVKKNFSLLSVKKQNFHKMKKRDQHSNEMLNQMFI